MDRFFSQKCTIIKIKVDKGVVIHENFFFSIVNIKLPRTLLKGLFQ